MSAWNLFNSLSENDTHAYQFYSNQASACWIWITRSSLRCQGSMDLKCCPELSSSFLPLRVFTICAIAGIQFKAKSHAHRNVEFFNLNFFLLWHALRTALCQILNYLSVLFRSNTEWTIKNCNLLAVCDSNSKTSQWKAKPATTAQACRMLDQSLLVLP